MNRDDPPDSRRPRRPAAASPSASPPTACGASFRSTSRRSRRSPRSTSSPTGSSGRCRSCALLLFSGTAGARFARRFATGATLVLLAVTALLIGVNWLLYVYAVTSGHILAGSLGYYLNPLANVLLGRFVLKERLSRLQWAAVAIAAAGISALAIGALGQLVDQPHPVRQLRDLWPAAEDRAGRCAGRAGDRDRAPVPLRAGLARSGGLAAGTPIFGTVAAPRGADCLRRSRLDHAAAAVHGGRAAAALFDAGHAPVPRPDAAVPARGLALRRAVHDAPMRSPSARSGPRSRSMSLPWSATLECPSPCRSKEHGAVSPIVMPMKRVLAALALLAVAACDPYYGQEPYGPQPYPYPDVLAPYPPGALPAGAYPSYPRPAALSARAAGVPDQLVERLDGLDQSDAGTGSEHGRCSSSPARWSRRLAATRSRSTRGCRSAKSYPAQAFVTLQVADPDGAPAVAGASHARGPLGMAAQ